MNRAAFPHRIVWLSLALALLLAAVWPLAPRRPEAAALGSDTQRITNLAPALNVVFIMHPLNPSLLVVSR
jgi:hypothetical protein